MLRRPHRASSRRESRPQLEAFESRLQPSGIVPFVGFHVEYDGFADFPRFPIHVLSQDFQMPGRKLLLTAQSEAGTRVSGGVGTLSARPNGRSVLAVVAGDNTVVARGARGSSYTFELGLAGDANGDFRVNGEDLAIIRADIKSRSGGGTAADVTGDGRVTRADLWLARRNLGASTTVRPLTLSEHLAGKTAVNAKGELINSKIGVVGQTAPGQVVTLSQTSAGSNLTQHATATADGAYEFNVGLGGGTTLLVASASDGFGQHAQVSRTVSRPPPASPLHTDHKATAVLVNDFGSTITSVVFTHYVSQLDFDQTQVKASSLAPGATLSLSVTFQTGTGALIDVWNVSFTDGSGDLWSTRLPDRFNLEGSDANTTFNATIENRDYPSADWVFTPSSGTGTLHLDGVPPPQ